MAIKDEKLREEELNFLKEELKRINTKIKTANYAGDKIEMIEAQIKLWELREKIMKDLSKHVFMY
ncbi:hypothetical protein E3V08_02415 [Candidatus Atribacteria bacterium MT.SAG.1]|nr:hypothetical protein E3V08_02415 [Candidatus Atribacteria bacterium MT.SAG.1]